MYQSRIEKILMSTNKSITFTPRIKLPTSDLSWIEEKLWSSKLREEVYRSLSGQRSSIIKFYEDHKSQALQKKYALVEGDEVLAWGIPQIYQSKFRTCVLPMFFTEKLPKELVQAASSVLVSCTFISADCDSIRVIDVRNDSLIYLDCLSPKTKLLSPSHEGPAKGRFLKPYSSWTLTKELWLGSEFYEEKAQPVERAIAKKKISEAKQEKAPSRKKRSLIARLLKPRIEDSFL